jgi:CBS domain-containing protein
MPFTIREVMGSSFLSAERTLSTLEGARRMVAARHGYILLVEEGRPVGIVTEWDIVEKVVARGRDPSTIPLDDIATRPVISSDLATSTTDVIDLMVKRGIRRMVVTDGGRIVGEVEARNVFQSFGGFVDRLSAEIARLQSTYP